MNKLFNDYKDINKLCIDYIKLLCQELDKQVPYYKDNNVIYMHVYNLGYNIALLLDGEDVILHKKDIDSTKLRILYSDNIDKELFLLDKVSIYI